MKSTDSLRRAYAVNKFITYFFLILGALIMVFPFAWMILTSSKTIPESLAVPPTIFPEKIMFDNFSPELTREAVRRVAGRCETESSGGITLETLRDYAACGVDFISVGALTHQIKSLDMSLKACE